MEDHAWSSNCNESNDELRQKLGFLTLELESVKMKAHDDMKRYNEAIEELRNTNRNNVANLLELLRVACQERDEAKLQLQQLLSMLCSSQMQPDNLFGSSSISESNNTTPFSDCFLEGRGRSSTEFSNINVGDTINVGFANQSVLQNDSSYDPSALVHSPKPKMDVLDILIDNYAKGRPLPEKGRFYEAVVKAGPLLETLLGAANKPRPMPALPHRPALPRWKNPPPLSQVKAPAFTP